jgi:large subunit ribosomal protein L10
MPNERKTKDLEKLKKMVKEYPVISLIELHKLPSSQLHAIKKELRADATVKMSKKRIARIAFKESKRKDLEKLIEYDVKKPAFIFSEASPFRLFKLVERKKSPAYAKEGDIATKDIVIPEGPTKLMAGPAIGDLQRAKIPAKVQDGKIHVIKDTRVAKQGDVITEQTANLLKKLDIQAGEIGIYMVAAWEDGVIFGRDVLNVDEKAYLDNLMLAATYGVNLSVNTAYPTRETIELLLIKAHQEAKNLGMEAEILEKDVIEGLLVKGESQAKALKAKAGLQ